ncbi:MAG: hypothetical protein D6731_19355 [Planctomycetota bacterium]|nr:MAG: hypothetical protein D6731_19355 [Planctomycetota bacterium]
MSSLAASDPTGASSPSPQAPLGPRARRLRGPACAVGLVVALLLARAPSLSEPLNEDITLYSLVANEVLHGRALYTEVFEAKGPFLYACYAAAIALAGCTPLAPYLLSCVFGTICLAGAYAVGGALRGDRTAGWLAAGLWVVVGGDGWLQGETPNAELFVNACTLGGWALLLKADVASSRRLRWALAAGFLLAAGSAFKQNAAFLAASLAAGWIVGAERGRPRREAVASALCVALSGLGLWLVLALVFLASGRLGDLWTATVAYPRFHVGQSMLDNLVSGLPRLFPAWTLRSLGLLLLAILLGLPGWKRERRLLATFVALALGTLLTHLTPGKLFPHYWQHWLPLFVVGAAWSATHPRVRRVAPLLLLVLSALPQLDWYLRDGEWRSRAKFGSLYSEAPRAGRELDALLAPKEQVYVWPELTGPTFYSGRRPPSGILWRRFALVGPGHQARQRLLLRDLERSRPELVLFLREDARFSGDDPVTRWLAAHYEPPPRPLSFGRGRYVGWVRRAGALHRRLLGPGSRAR